MSRTLNLSAINDAIEDALEVIGKYLDTSATPDANDEDRAYAKKLQPRLTLMKTMLEEDCPPAKSHKESFIPLLRDR